MADGALCARARPERGHGPNDPVDRSSQGLKDYIEQISNISLKSQKLPTLFIKDLIFTKKPRRPLGDELMVLNSRKSSLCNVKVSIDTHRNLPPPLNS